MTNEDKANELAFEENGTFLPRSVAIEKQCLAMAKWKDAQLDEELNLITDWFNHIVQIADDKKTANGVVMKDSDAFAEIKCIAKSSAEYINSCLVTK